MTAEAFVALASIPVFIFILVIPAALLRLAERRFPAFSRWLDRRFGPENAGFGKPW